MNGPAFGYVPYEPPSAHRGRPAVIAWFRVYAASLLLLYLAMTVALGWVIVSAAPDGLGETPAASATVSAWLFVVGVLAVAGVAVHGVAAAVPYKPWGWTLGLVVICLGISSALAPAAIPLLVFWMKPATKAAFGRL